MSVRRGRAAALLALLAALVGGIALYASKREGPASGGGSSEERKRHQPLQVGTAARLTASTVVPALAAKDPSLLILPGAISGRVQAASGEVPKGLSVEVRQEPTMVERPEVKRFPVLLLEDGSFRADDLPAGWDYVVEAGAPGFAPVRQHGLEVRAGQATDVGLLTLSRGGELQVRVTDPFGNPQPKADVAVVRRFSVETLDEAFAQHEARGETGPGGIIRFSALSAGPRTIAVRASGHPPAVLAKQWILDGQLTELEVKLEPSVAIAGRVTDLFDKPIGGASVRLEEDATLFASNVEVRTDTAGRFMAPALGARPYRVVAQADGYAPDVREGVVSGDTEVHLRLELAGGVEGTVTDSSGQSVAAFAVRLHSLERSEASASQPFQDGRFVLNNVPPGRYRLEAEADGFAPTIFEPVAVQPARVSGPVRLVLDKGTTVTGQVTSASGDRVAGATVVLKTAQRGAAHDEPGHGEPGHDEASHGKAAEAEAAPAEGPDHGAARSATAFTDESGRFAFQHVASEGPWEVRASHPAYASATLTTSQKDIRLVLPEPGEVAGRVLRNFQGAPGEVVVIFGGAETNRRAVTDGEGRYQIGGLEEGQYNLVVIKPNDLGNLEERAMTPVMIHAGRRTLMDLTLGSEEGTVRVACSVTSRGQAVSGALVLLTFMNQGRSDESRCVTDLSGKCALEDVPPGAATVIVARDPRGEQAVVRREILLPSTPEFPLALEIPMGELRGRVVLGASGEAAIGATVSVTMLQADNPEVISGMAYVASADARGGFQFMGLPFGTYRIVAKKAGFARAIVESHRLDPAAFEGASAPLRVELQPGAWVDVAASDSAGNPVRGVFFEVWTKDGRPIDNYTTGPGMTGERGTVSLDTLPAVPLVLVAQRDGFEQSRLEVPGEARRHNLSVVMRPAEVAETGGQP